VLQAWIKLGFYQFLIGFFSLIVGF